MHRHIAAFALLMLPGPVVAQQQWHLVEELRIGGATTGPAAFADVRSLAIDGTGRIYVVDFGNDAIQLFDASGRYVRAVGRSGAGPGEYRQPYGVLIAPDGRVWVNDADGGRLVVFNPDGSVAAHVPRTYHGFSYAWAAAFDPAGRLMELVPGPDVARVIRFDPRTAVWDDLAMPRCLPDAAPVPLELLRWTYRTAGGGGSVGIPFAPRQVWHLDPQGAWWCGSATDYHIQQASLATGALLRELRRDQGRVRIPNQIRDSVQRYYEATFTRVPPGTFDFSMMPREYPMFEGLMLDDAGNLWAMRNAAQGLVAEVWSPQGRLISSVKVPEGRHTAVASQVRRGKFYSIALDEDDVPSVVRYRIEKR